MPPKRGKKRVSKKKIVEEPCDEDASFSKDEEIFEIDIVDEAIGNIVKDEMTVDDASLTAYQEEGYFHDEEEMNENVDADINENENFIDVECDDSLNENYDEDLCGDNLDEEGVQLHASAEDTFSICSDLGASKSGAPNSPNLESSANDQNDIINATKAQNNTESRLTAISPIQWDRDDDISDEWSGEDAMDEAVTMVTKTSVVNDDEGADNRTSLRNVAAKTKRIVGTTKALGGPSLFDLPSSNAVNSSVTIPSLLGSTSLSVALSSETEAQLRQLFSQPGVRYYLIKSHNYENVAIAKARSVWSTTLSNERRLNSAFVKYQSVFLIFSVRESGAFQGYARLASGSHPRERIDWVLPPTMNPAHLSGAFHLDWLSRTDVPFPRTIHLLNTWNENKPVKIGRDGQELDPQCGEALCRIFPLEVNNSQMARLLDNVANTKRSLPSGAPTLSQGSPSPPPQRLSNSQNERGRRGPNTSTNHDRGSSRRGGRSSSTSRNSIHQRLGVSSQSNLSSVSALSTVMNGVLPAALFANFAAASSTNNSNPGLLPPFLNTQYLNTPSIPSSAPIPLFSTGVLPDLNMLASTYSQFLRDQTRTGSSGNVATTKASATANENSRGVVPRETSKRRERRSPDHRRSPKNRRSPKHRRTPEHRRQSGVVSNPLAAESYEEYLARRNRHQRSNMPSTSSNVSSYSSTNTMDKDEYEKRVNEFLRTVNGPSSQSSSFKRPSNMSNKIFHSRSPSPPYMSPPKRPRASISPEVILRDYRPVLHKSPSPSPLYRSIHRLPGRLERGWSSGEEGSLSSGEERVLRRFLDGRNREDFSSIDERDLALAEAELLATRKRQTQRKRQRGAHVGKISLSPSPRKHARHEDLERNIMERHRKDRRKRTPSASLSPDERYLSDREGRYRQQKVNKVRDLSPDLRQRREHGMKPAWRNSSPSPLISNYSRRRHRN